MIWAADEPGEEPAVDCGDTDLTHNTAPAGHGGVLTTKNFLARKASKFCTVTTSRFTGNLMKEVTLIGEAVQQLVPCKKEAVLFFYSESFN